MWDGRKTATTRRMCRAKQAHTGLWSLADCAVDESSECIQIAMNGLASGHDVHANATCGMQCSNAALWPSLLHVEGCSDQHQMISKPRPPCAVLKYRRRTSMTARSPMRFPNNGQPRHHTQRPSRTLDSVWQFKWGNNPQKDPRFYYGRLCEPWSTAAIQAQAPCTCRSSLTAFA